MIGLRVFGLMFQSTPDLVNRENFTDAILKLSHIRFQSTPDLVNRENAVQQPVAGIHKRFQSTPDLVNRENGITDAYNAMLGKVSIHSRFS